MRTLTKQLTCPQCGDVLADAVYRPWSARLTITSPTGAPVAPTSGALQLRLARQAAAAAPPAQRQEAADRVTFVERNLGELLYEFRCPRGHSVLRTAPQLTRAMRRAQGRWVSLA